MIRRCANALTLLAPLNRGHAILQVQDVPPEVDGLPRGIFGRARLRQRAVRGCGFDLASAARASVPVHVHSGDWIGISCLLLCFVFDAASFCLGLREVAFFIFTLRPRGTFKGGMDTCGGENHRV